MITRMEWATFAKIAPGVNDALLSLSRAVQQSGLDPSLLELVKMRASLINGCAFCIQYHSANALKLGITNDRLTLLSAWVDAPVYSERERAALRWTDVLTKMQAIEDVSDAEYSSVQEHFSDVELANLTGAIVLINAWNRIAKAYRFSPPITIPSNKEQP
jgi:AhpD family alkylhydroperoxidase